MSDREKIIASLESKGLLDEPSVRRLRKLLKKKLKDEADCQEEEMLSLKDELAALQNQVNDKPN